MKYRSWPPAGSVVQPLGEASLVLFKCVLHGTQQRCRVVRLFDNRREVLDRKALVKIAGSSVNQHMPRPFM